MFLFLSLAIEIKLALHINSSRKKKLYSNCSAGAKTICMHCIKYISKGGWGTEKASGIEVENRFHAFCFLLIQIVVYWYTPRSPSLPFFSLYSLSVCLFDCGAVIIKTEPWGNADLTPKRSDTFWHWHISKGEKHLEICMREINVSTEKKH